MARRKISSPKALAKMWEEYKAYCDSYTIKQMVDTTYTDDNGTTTSTKVEKDVLSPITYTKIAFLKHIGITRQSFHVTYEQDPAYADTVELISMECEIDARRKFETEQVNSRLAALWMSNYGYGTKTDAAVEHKADNNLLDAIQSSQADLGPGDDDDL